MQGLDSSAFKLFFSNCSNFVHLKVLGTGRLRFLGGSFGTFECTNSLVKSIFEYFLAKRCYARNMSKLESVWIFEARRQEAIRQKEFGICGFHNVLLCFSTLD